jgi:hypothetical protein
LKNKRFIKKEGFRYHYVLKHNKVEQVQLTRRRNPIELEVGHGVDFIGDVHACYDEFLNCLAD